MLGNDSNDDINYPSPSDEKGTHRSSFYEDLSFIKRTLDDCAANIAAKPPIGKVENEDDFAMKDEVFDDQFTLGPSTSDFLFNVSPITNDELTSEEDAANNNDAMRIDLDLDMNMNLNIDLDMDFLTDNERKEEQNHLKMEDVTNEKQEDHHLNLDAKELQVDSAPLLALSNDSIPLSIAVADDDAKPDVNTNTMTNTNTHHDVLDGYAALIDCSVCDGGILGGTETSNVAVEAFGGDVRNSNSNHKKRTICDIDIGLGSSTITTSIFASSPGRKKKKCFPHKSYLNSNFMRQTKARTYTDATPSKHCHICSSRPSYASPHVVCSNLARGTCRKTVCAKCFAKHGWDLHAATNNNNGGWKCTHCRSECPPAAQCFIYGRTTARRRQNAMRARAATRRAMLIAEKLVPTAHNINLNTGNIGNGNININIPPIATNNTSIVNRNVAGLDHLAELTPNDVSDTLNHWLVMDSLNQF